MLMHSNCIFLALIHVYSFLKHNIDKLPGYLMKYISDPADSGVLTTIQRDHIQYSMGIVCWLLYQLTCSYQSELLNRMGDITALKFRTRFSKPTLEGTKLAWICMMAWA